MTLSSMWNRIHNIFKVAKPIQRPLRDKAIAVAETVSVDYKGLLEVPCPVCSQVICASPDSDLKIILAVHLSLWHPDDVKEKWEKMHKTKRLICHSPSFMLGVGAAAVCAALLSLLAKNHIRASKGKLGSRVKLELR